MGTQPIIIDPAAEAQELSDFFHSMSQQLDEFRIADHDPPIPSDQLALLKKKAQDLEDLSHQFLETAMAATLQSIQSDLARIKSAIKTAKDQLNKLNDISKALTLATAIAKMGVGIIAKDPHTFRDAVKDLEKTA